MNLLVADLTLYSHKLLDIQLEMLDTYFKRFSAYSEISTEEYRAAY